MLTGVGAKGLEGYRQSATPNSTPVIAPDNLAEAATVRQSDSPPVPFRGLDCRLSEPARRGTIVD
jgi:hypothetical protein